MKSSIIVIMCALFIVANWLIVLASNQKKYEIFHFTHVYSDGSKNDMICIFDHNTGEYRTEIIQ